MIFPYSGSKLPSTISESPAAETMVPESWFLSSILMLIVNSILPPGKFSFSTTPVHWPEIGSSIIRIPIKARWTDNGEIRRLEEVSVDLPSSLLAVNSIWKSRPLTDISPVILPSSIFPEYSRSPRRPSRIHEITPVSGSKVPSEISWSPRRPSMVPVTLVPSSSNAKLNSARSSGMRSEIIRPVHEPLTGSSSDEPASFSFVDSFDFSAAFFLSDFFSLDFFFFSSSSFFSSSIG